MFDYTDLSASLYELCTSIDRNCEFLAKMRKGLGANVFGEIVLRELKGEKKSLLWLRDEGVASIKSTPPWKYSVTNSQKFSLCLKVNTSVNKVNYSKQLLLYVNRFLVYLEVTVNYFHKKIINIILKV